MRSPFFLFALCLFSGFLVLPDLVHSQEEPSREQGGDGPAPPKIIRKSAHLLQIGEVVLDRRKGMITVKGEVNMSEGLVEYLACDPQGKLHESVLTLFAEPYHIHVAMLLLGLVPGDRPIDFQGADDLPCGGPVQIFISWKENGATVTCGPEQLVKNVQSGKIMAPSDWVFAGSQIRDGQYMAQVERSIAAIYHDPFAILDHRAASGSEDTFMYANEDLLPPKGTPVEFMIFPVDDPAVKTRTACRPRKERKEK